MLNDADIVGDNDDDFSITEFEDYKSADVLLAHELNQLTSKERDEINEEIHGIRQHHYPKETPELLQGSLRKFRNQLDFLPSNHAYEKSKTFPKSYVNTDDFYLIFLRFEYFDARKAATRMLKYLNVIYVSFGEKVLQRDICLDDFDERAFKFLKSGYHQLLPGRDRYGRRIAGNFVFDIDPEQPKENRVLYQKIKEFHLHYCSVFGSDFELPNSNTVCFSKLFIHVVHRYDRPFFA